MKKKSSPHSLRYTCTDYRQEMILAALQRRLRDENLNDREREKLFEQIRELEHKIGL